MVIYLSLINNSDSFFIRLIFNNLTIRYMYQNTLQTLNFTKTGLINNSPCIMITTSNDKFICPQTWSNIVPITLIMSSRNNANITFKDFREPNKNIVYGLKGYASWPITNPSEIKKYPGKLYTACVYSRNDAGLTSDIIFSPTDNQVNMIQYSKNKIISWLLGTAVLV